MLGTEEVPLAVTPGILIVTVAGLGAEINKVLSECFSKDPVVVDKSTFVPLMMTSDHTVVGRVISISPIVFSTGLLVHFAVMPVVVGAGKFSMVLSL